MAFWKGRFINKLEMVGEYLGGSHVSKVQKSVFGNQLEGAPHNKYLVLGQVLAFDFLIIKNKNRYKKYHIGTLAT